MNKIDKFEGEYRFLSNFYTVPITHNGKIYPTSEHLYQALKTADVHEQERIRSCPNPGAAKKEGKNITIRKDWDEVKEYVMREILKLKFEQNPEVAQKLLSTGNAELIEGNWWHDYYWGMCDGLGQNKLGELLMELREELRTSDG